MEREKSYRILKIADPFQELMLRGGCFLLCFFFPWEGWMICTELLGCLGDRAGFSCNNEFFSFLLGCPEAWR